MEGNLEIVCQTASYWQLRKLRSIVHKALKKRFAGSKPVKYGTLNKGFTEQELLQFLRNVKNDKFRLLFKYQAYLGLRIGEACSLGIGNFNFEKKELIIKSEKSNKIDALLIPADLFRETVNFILRNQQPIKNSSNHIFFKENDNNRNRVQHVNLHYVRKVFREAVGNAGLEFVYAYTDEDLYNRNQRKLHRLTTHSLRHYAITRFAKGTNGNLVLVSRFARHADPSTTMRYISKDNEELYKNIESVFNDTPVLKRSLNFV